ncbi:hypothetical protein NDR87_21535 [Nocardia sp. CDC159]|uniref:Uncharacterized protein n=1 Tax=Nocardia pulmonis TaxID=2951408 RepID=A0A9X2IZA3_9NOCA|nr:MULTISPECIES: hypothetical protein [Nocardia]MCM6776529.1 hypothetical protein [Nocardia pulmonis]MCM6788953.1 hypothetical protein [Nocardia sp. CDC159]
MGDGNRVVDLLREARALGLEVDSKAAERRADACETAIVELRRLLKEAEGLHFAPRGFGPLPSGRKLAARFNEKRTELRRMLEWNIRALAEMRDTFREAGRIYRAAEARSTEAFDRILSSAPAGGDRADVRLHNGTTVEATGIRTWTRRAVDPSTGQSRELPSSPSKYTVRHNIYAAPTVAAGVRTDPPLPVEAGVGPEQVEGLAHTIDVTGAVEVAARWSRLSRALSTAFTEMSSGIQHRSDWHSAGADAARKAARELERQSRVLAAGITDMSENLEYAAKVMYQTRDFMNACLPVNPHEITQGHPLDRWRLAQENLKEANELFRRVYVAGVTGVSDQMPVLDAAVPRIPGAPGPAAPPDAGPGPGGGSGGKSGGKRGPGPGGKSGPRRKYRLRKEPQRDRERKPGGQGRNRVAPKQPPAKQQPPEPSQPRQQDGMQLAQALQRALQDGGKAFDGAAKAASQGSAMPGSGGIDPKSGRSALGGKGDAGSGAGGGSGAGLGSAGLGSKPEPRPPNPQSQLFPRASVTGAPPPSAPQAGPAPMAMPGAPGAAGAAGRGAQQGQDGEHKRLEALTHKDNAEELVGPPTTVVPPVLGQ